MPPSKVICIECKKPLSESDLRRKRKYHTQCGHIRGNRRAADRFRPRKAPWLTKKESYKRIFTEYNKGNERNDRTR